ncbi:MAG: sigma-54-dependent Fis family transcriptional regulator [Candidatus Riflebacteria bacterium]|nr:sigma-54-dependent Fis family transcriptional regulator [Candidatus Riflebacteria bacterium]
MLSKTDTAIKDVLLLALGEMIGRETSADQMLHPLVDVMRELLQADRGTIFLLDDDGKELVSVAAHLPEMKEIRVPVSQGIAGWVARTHRMVNIPFCESDSRFWKKIDSTTGYTTRSVLAGPLDDAAGNLLGVVQFLNKREGMFTGHDEELLATMARQVGALLEETTLGKGPDFLVAEDGETDDAPGAAGRTDGASEAAVGLGERFNRIIGVGEPMKAVFRTIRKVAPTEATVLLRGESGTGKGLIAKAIHYTSMRHAAPFVKLDCTALPDGLVENELFGHEQGAYTGAHTRTRGKVETAEGGTLFLDEIGDLPLPLQGKLLTLLQERTYSRVGAAGSLKSNVRIVAATNRPLEELVRAGEFRQDLYYRLRVVQVELPPLRERGREDLLRLINHFVAVAAKRHRSPVRRLLPEALEALLAHPWPGNVRELQNCLESAVIFSEGEITRALLPLPRPDRGSTDPRHGGSGGGSPELPYEDEPTLQQLEARYRHYLLERKSGNRSVCARVLGIGRNTLLRKLRSLGIGNGNGHGNGNGNGTGGCGAR